MTPIFRLPGGLGRMNRDQTYSSRLFNLPGNKSRRGFQLLKWDYLRDMSVAPQQNARARDVSRADHSRSLTGLGGLAHHGEHVRMLCRCGSAISPSRAAYTFPSQAAHQSPEITRPPGLSRRAEESSREEPASHRPWSANPGRVLP